MEETVSIGRLVATFGVKGELVLSHGLGRRAEFEGLGALLVEVQRGSRLPYFLESAKARSLTETLVKLEGVNTKEEAAALLQKQVWVPESAMAKLADPRATIALIGYTVLQDGKPLGEVREVIEQPHQVICVISIENREVLIPLHEQTLLRIDRARRQIHVKLPDGLLEVYLNG